MKELFQQRRTVFLKRCAKYLRYVLNDHFVLVLLVFMGFLSLQYRQLLVDFPKDTRLVLFGLFGVNLILLFSGKIGTYLEEADQVFLLTKEVDVSKEFVSATKRSFVIWTVFQFLVQLLLLPIYLKLGLPLWIFPIYWLGLLLVKILLVKRQKDVYYIQGNFSWAEAIRREKARQQNILRFFALFTTVKGITTTVKRRRYLDWWMDGIKGRYRKTWVYLYVRACIRAGDYLGLTVRLLFLGILSLLSIEDSWLSIGLVVVFHYLLLFQLLGLYKHYDYQYLTELYPLDKRQKKLDFQLFLRMLLYTLLAVEMIVALVLIQEKMMVVFLIFSGVLLHEVYLPLKLKKLID